ncbi:MAG: cobalamin B12-binding domain-containing protein [Chloroflexi bacterium]|nr:cobalamin B12-binding domain-containing protein [Chloroflexota bacterium]
MLKIVLVNPPQPSSYPQPPMGLALIAAVVEKEGYEVRVVDANALRLKPSEIVPLATDADIVGLTAMTPTINAAISTARYLKQANHDLTIVLGGAHATLLPDATLASAPEIDMVVKGEGEQTIIELLRALESRQPLDNIAGISYRRNGEVHSTAVRSANVDLDSLPFLAYHLLPWVRYRPHPPHGRALPFAAMITSRGCPYHCSYCSKPIFGNRFRAQSSERIIEEIIYYKEKFGVKEIAFYDDVFTLDKKRAYAIADSIIKKGLKICWTCETRVNLVDKELLRHMKQAGCYAIAYGIESASPEILATLDKGITLGQVEEAVSLTQQVGLQTIGYFMLGSPGESPETITRTIQFSKKLKLDFAQFAITTPCPSPRLYELYQQDKKGDVPWENFVYEGAGRSVTPVFETDGLNRAELQHWMKRAYREFYLRPSYLWQRLRQIHSPGDLRVNLKGLAMLWQSLKGS